MDCIYLHDQMISTIRNYAILLFYSEIEYEKLSCYKFFVMVQFLKFQNHLHNSHHLNVHQEIEPMVNRMDLFHQI